MSCYFLDTFCNLTLTIQTNLAFKVGDFVQVTHDVNNYIIGQVTSYDVNTGVINIDPIDYCGSGNYCDWTVNLAGKPGIDGTMVGSEAVIVSGSTTNSSIRKDVSNTASADFSAALGGSGNTSSCVGSVVVGGFNNISCNTLSFIGGGYCNTSSGCLSFIGGGSGNTVTSNYSGAFGCGVLNDLSCSFMSNQLRACNLSGTTVALCVGTDGTIVRNDSDIRLKTSICPITYGTNEISQLNPVSFYWCDNEKERRGCNKQVGFIAQEVEPIIPEAVGQGADGIYSLDPNKIIPALVKSIQELTKRVEELEKK